MTTTPLESLLSLGKDSDYKCPTCQKQMLLIPSMFYRQDRMFPGLVCKDCNAVFEYPEDHWGYTPIDIRILAQRVDKK